jgi:hypothetical protein
LKYLTRDLRLKTLNVTGTVDFDSTLNVDSFTTGPAFNSGTASLNDDQAGYFTFSATASRGILCISGNVDAAGSAIVAFRVGDNIFCRALGSGISAGAVATTTGALAGTTGSDGNLTLSVTLTATGNRFYIENRTGGARGYAVSILGGVAGTIGAFTTV